MKRLSIIIVSIIFIACFTSCCKDLCLKEQLHLYFIGFDRLDLDTIDTKIYEPSSNFTQQVDSQRMIYGLETMDTTPVTLSMNVQLDKDIAIVLPSTAQQYQLTDFQTKREPCGCGQGDRKIVTAYMQDGTPRTGTEIYLHK